MVTGGEIEEGKGGRTYVDRRISFGWWTHNAIYWWTIIELYTQNLYNLINQCHPNTFNKSLKSIPDKLCSVLLSHLADGLFISYNKFHCNFQEKAHTGLLFVLHLTRLYLGVSRGISQILTVQFIISTIPVPWLVSATHDIIATSCLPQGCWYTFRENIPYCSQICQLWRHQSST